MSDYRTFPSMVGPQYVERYCEYCGEAFEVPRRSDEQYCSITCHERDLGRIE